MNIEVIVSRFPETVPVFMKYGFHCLGCAMASFENLEQGASAHGIDVKKFVEDLNKVVDKEKPTAAKATPKVKKK